MSSSHTCTFPFKVEDDDSIMEAIKWTQGTSRYEIYISHLRELELGQLLPHCLTFKSKIEAAIGTPAHVGPSLFRAFPRTISPILRSVWDQVLEAGDDQVLVDTIEGFTEALKMFIAVHATADDCHDLLQQLCNPKKPCDHHVQSFWYRMRELNGYVDWLPGNESALDDAQLKQAFYDAMPRHGKTALFKQVIPTFT